MPGSVTIGHAEALVLLSHPDAERLTTMLRQMSSMLEASGPNRLTEAQVTELCEGRMENRGELTEWCRNLSQYLNAHL
ncbi:hypothetical protein AB0D08_19535 [Kitasatospora sp. NPDC048540]|uniref:hypothetical protein n=1 Tax=unclassified Kitasatospora TaxID=2633591 RepID=UPI00053A0819|nr:hypothetical protein [Kitasatospora sp. MBT63]